jgi:hypothetical protein
MKCPADRLVTPIHLKDQPDMPWPEDERAFYVLAANGLFRCRNHPFFRSCVPAPEGPSELAQQKAFLDLRYPKLPRKAFELVVGFFARVGELHGAEAAVLLAWDPAAGRVRLVVPEQVATVSRNWWGDRFPIGLNYEVPATLPAHWVLMGDVHSHVDGAAYASAVDRDDETYRAGLHVVVGRLYREPPELYAAAVVDGMRFKVDPALVLEGYQRRRLKVPRSWLSKVKVEPHSYAKKAATYTVSTYHDTGRVSSPKREDHDD